MSFWINDKSGIAYESTEAGCALWSVEDDSFSKFMSSAERREFCFPCRRVSEDEAEAFARSKHQKLH